MASIAVGPDDVIVGVDTHKDTHVAVALNGLGARLDELSFPASTAGYDQALAWARSHGNLVTAGIEGTSSYGRGLARHLTDTGVDVIEVTRPPRPADRRRIGKDDSIDAEAAARQVLAGIATALPKSGDGPVEALRVLRVARSAAVKAQTQAMVSLRSLIITADDGLRQQLAGLGAKKLAQACTGLDTTGDPTDPTVATNTALASIAGRWLGLRAEISALDPKIDALTKTTAPQLRAQTGIGPESAAQLLITLGDNRDRVRTEAQFARLCGVCPIPAGSGRTNGRHRLNRGGDRQANAALHRIAIVRLRRHEPTQAYLARSLANGKTKKEAIRCIKRYIAREAFNLLTNPPLDI